MAASSSQYFRVVSHAYILRVVSHAYILSATRKCRSPLFLFIRKRHPGIGPGAQLAAGRIHLHTTEQQRELIFPLRRAAMDWRRHRRRCILGSTSVRAVGPTSSQKAV